MYCCPECNRFFETDQEPTDKDQVFFCPHCNAAIMFYDAVELKKGSMIAGFRLIERLGEGGMGTVYLAEQVSIKRKVALKVLSEELVQKKESVDRFMKEVKTTARLEHPAIVAAIDAGDYRGIYFFAMSYVDGIDLETWLETRGRLTETRALKFVIRIAEALQYAWDKHRLLHRDIKPGNIMVDQHDEAFLLDMGIAQHFSETFERREETEGSPYYISPEQSYSAPMDWSSDLYSLGASLYHMVVGVPPYDAPDIMEIVKMHSSQPFPDPAKRNPQAPVSAGIVKLLRRMMGKSPQDRFASWEEFINAARDLLRQLSEGKTPHHFKTKRRHYYTKRLLLIGGTAAAVLAVIAMTVFLFVKARVEFEADAALKLAEDYLQRPDSNPNYAVSLFHHAIQDASAKLVSQEKLYRARAGLLLAEKAQKDELLRRDQFLLKYRKAAAVHSAASQAGDPREAVKKCREARQLTALLKPGTEEEFRRVEQLNKKIDILEKVSLSSQNSSQNPSR